MVPPRFRPNRQPSFTREGLGATFGKADQVPPFAEAAPTTALQTYHRPPFEQIRCLTLSSALSAINHFVGQAKVGAIDQQIGITLLSVIRRSHFCGHHLFQAGPI